MTGKTDYLTVPKCVDLRDSLNITVGNLLLVSMLGVTGESSCKRNSIEDFKEKIENQASLFSPYHSQIDICGRQNRKCLLVRIINPKFHNLVLHVFFKYKLRIIRYFDGNDKTTTKK